MSGIDTLKASSLPPLPFSSFHSPQSPTLLFLSLALSRLSISLKKVSGGAVKKMLMLMKMHLRKWAL